jgi:hypothetical protein
MGRPVENGNPVGAGCGGRAPVKTIAVDLDDTLNDFTATLRSANFPADPRYPLPDAVFKDYLARVRDGATDSSELLVTEYSFFRQRIHLQCYQLAGARPDGVAFMRWLKSAGWRIVICSSRDLRRAGPATRAWLGENSIPFDHLFMAANKIAFCRAWDIPHLVDDDVFTIIHGPRYGVKVYYPCMDKHRSLAGGGARGFASFEEVRRWIQE